MENLLTNKYGYKHTLAEYVRKATLQRAKLMEGQETVLQWLDELISLTDDKAIKKSLLGDREWFRQRLTK